MRKKIGRNSNCPCLSGLKYKNCCQGNIDWELILGENKPFSQYLSPRGKNLIFIQNIAGILELDNLGEYSYEKFKKAFTPSRVRRIYELIPQLWPDYNDLERILNIESKSLNSLYIGNYTPSTIENGLRKHSLYNERILLIDPFSDPRIMAPNFNPLDHPELHIENAINAVRILFSVEEWIRNNFVIFIKTPGDFNASLEIDCMQYEMKKFKEHPEFNENISIPDEFFKQMQEYNLIAQPNSTIIKKAKELNPQISANEISILLDQVEVKRKEHPFFVPLYNEENKSVRSSLMLYSSGTNYEMAKIISSITNSNFITDLPNRWKEIEYDHKSLKIEQNEWSSFIKAFQNLDFKFFDQINLDYVLKVRKENKLANIRSFLSRLWRTSSLENKYSDENIKILKEELEHHFREAESEWSKINQDLLKWVRNEILGIGATAEKFITSGQSHLLIGGIVISGITTAIVDWSKRQNFKLKYPTSFMLDLKRKSKT